MLHTRYDGKNYKPRPPRPSMKSVHESCIKSMDTLTQRERSDVIAALAMRNATHGANALAYPLEEPSDA